MQDVQDAIALNRQGIDYFKQGNFAEAALSYQAAIQKRPDYVDAYYNLGLALVKLQRREEAKNAYEAVIALDDHHLGGHFQLGCLLMQRNNYQDAQKQFARIEQYYPDHYESIINLAACFLRLGYLNEAKSRYLRALALIPNDTQVLFNLGVISMQQGRVQAAIDYYLQAVKIDAQFQAAHNNLGVAYLVLSNTASALLHFRAALRLDPANEAIRHSITILTQQQMPDISPPDYIRALFDSYADHYDSHLLKVLHYAVPQKLMALLSGVLPSSAEWHVLDIGAGTGLMGELIKPYAKTLTGVDLSKQMLAVAETKKIYDELTETDMLTFLAEKTNAYDLIVAGDVLVYVGDLEQVFAKVYNALKPGGLLLFNAEKGANAPYHLTEYGRFEHQQSYIDQLAKKHHFHVLRYVFDEMRIQEHKPLYGHFYLLQR